MKRILTLIIFLVFTSISNSQTDRNCEMMPTWQTMRLPDYPIDNIGIQPDIYIDKSVKDWIQFAIDYLEK